MVLQPNFEPQLSGPSLGAFHCRTMKGFISKTPTPSLFLVCFWCMCCLLILLARSQAQTTTNATTDPSEVRAINSIFGQWGVSVSSSDWNISGEPCSGKAVDSTTLDNFNPAIKCDCSFNSSTTCHITQLRVNGLQATGVIPEEIGNLPFLTNLILDQNYLTGPLPAFIGNLTSMQYLSVSINALTGDIPKELGKLQNLLSLSFSSNNFSGSLPPELGNLTKLQQIYIDSAGMSGEIPPTFAKLRNLNIVWASDNNISGKLPDFIGNNWTNITIFLRGLGDLDKDSFHPIAEELVIKDHESSVKAIYNGAEFLESATAGAEVGIVLQSTSFYGEQGGQIYDTGSLEGSTGTFQIRDVQIYGGFVLHIGSIGGHGTFHVGDKVICKVDYGRRTLIAPNHTCTHMLNFALREVLGDHVDQKGSIVLPEKLRFDFSHGKPIHPNDLREIEKIVNQQIKDELDVYGREANLVDAKRIVGLRAVFGEVYPDPVRVVSIGRKVEDLLSEPDNKDWLSISTELCGGTHISNTREAKAFALLSEEGIAKGVRRITAVTTQCALKAMELASSLDKEISDAHNVEGSSLVQLVASLKNRVDAAAIPAPKKADLRTKISQLDAEVRKAQKKIGEENIQKAVKAATEIAETAASEGKTFCVIRVNVGVDATAIREAVLKILEQKKISVMVFSTDEASNKAVVCAGVPAEVEKKGLAASKWLAAAVEPLKGKGGGKAGLAQGQGSDASHIDEAIDMATKFASMKLR